MAQHSDIADKGLRLEGPLLLPVLEYGEFIELRRVARVLHDIGGCEVLFYFVKRRYRSLHRHTSELVADGHAWIDSKGALHHEAAPESNDLRASPLVAADAPGRPKSSTPWKAAVVELVNLLFMLHRYSSDYRRARKLLNRIRPTAVVVSQDYVGSGLAMVLHAARRRGIRRILVPYAMFNLTEVREFAFDRPELHAENGWSNPLLARLFRKWVAEHRGRRLVRLEAAKALALELLGLSAPAPWVPCSGSAEIIAVESAASLTNFRAMGLPEDRLVMTGAVVHDRLAAVREERVERRADLCRELGLADGARLLLCLWPPNLIWNRRPCPEFDDYPSIVRFWSDTLAALQSRHQVNVVVKTHPKTTSEERQLVSATGLPVSELDTAELVPLCDLLVTIPSTVTAWAVALAIPVVEYDLYRFGYTDFAGLAGVTSSNRKEDFESALTRLCGDPAAWRTAAARQAEAAEHWGLLDGRAGDRLIGLFADLQRNEHEPRTLRCSAARADRSSAFEMSRCR